MNNIDRRDAEMPYISDSSVMEEQRITRRLVQELNTSDRGDFENIKPISRNSTYEYGIKVEIENNVWIGGNVVITPGVTIGDNVVIGAGSVITKDIPANVIAAGNPCRVIREITEDDKRYYYKNREFDEESWKVIQGEGSSESR